MTLCEVSVFFSCLAASRNKVMRRTIPQTQCLEKQKWLEGYRLRLLVPRWKSPFAQQEESVDRGIFCSNLSLNCSAPITLFWLPYMINLWAAYGTGVYWCIACILNTWSCLYIHQIMVLSKSVLSTLIDRMIFHLTNYFLKWSWHG